MTDVTLERKFIHDIATPLSVASIHTKRVLAELNGTEECADPQKQIERLEKAVKALASIEEFLIARRAAISND